MGSFYTAVNCMDGRVQLPVILHLRQRFHAEYIDTVTEPGPNRILAEQTDETAMALIMERIRISIEEHGSTGIAVVGHYDCAGNPAPEAVQAQQTAKAVTLVQESFPRVPVIGLWVDQHWQVMDNAAERDRP